MYMMENGRLTYEKGEEFINLLVVVYMMENGRLGNKGLTAAYSEY